MKDYIGNTYRQYKRRKARGDKMRPIWQIILFLPLLLLYFPAKVLVDWMEGN